VQRLVLVFVVALVAAACINQAKEAIAPTPETPGSMTCREIVEQCDSQCGDPLCLHRCTNEGTQEAQGQHAALLDCGQRNSCTDQPCMEQSCPTEITACMGAAPSEVAPTEAAPEGGAPGETPPSS
jgi:hypothetical protein